MFEIYVIHTENPYTYSLIKCNQENIHIQSIQGKVYELELVKVVDNSSEITKLEWVYTLSSFVCFYEHFPENSLANFENFFNEEINLDGDWRVAMSEIISPWK